jgi:hypothetical protein
MDRNADQSDERIPWLRVVVAAICAFAVFGVAVVAAIIDMRGMMGGLRDDASIARTEIGAAQIGMVEPRLIELEDRALKLHAERKAQLNGYSWVDRQRGLIRIPVEIGMQRVVISAADGRGPRSGARKGQR